MALETLKDKFHGFIQKLKPTKKSDEVYDDVVYIDPQSERALQELERRKSALKNEASRIRH